MQVFSNEFCSVYYSPDNATMEIIWKQAKILGSDDILRSNLITIRNYLEKYNPYQVLSNCLNFPFHFKEETTNWLVDKLEGMKKNFANNKIAFIVSSEQNIRTNINELSNSLKTLSWNSHLFENEQDAIKWLKHDIKEFNLA